jgi:hypothetical protein
VGKYLETPRGMSLSESDASIVSTPVKPFQAAKSSAFSIANGVVRSIGWRWRVPTAAGPDTLGSAYATKAKRVLTVGMEKMSTDWLVVSQSLFSDTYMSPNCANKMPRSFAEMLSGKLQS